MENFSGQRKKCKKLPCSSCDNNSKKTDRADRADRRGGGTGPKVRPSPMSHQVEMGKYTNTETEGSCYRGQRGRAPPRPAADPTHLEGPGDWEPEWKELDNEAAVSTDAEKQKR